MQHASPLIVQLRSNFCQKLLDAARHRNALRSMALWGLATLAGCNLGSAPKPIADAPAKATSSKPEFVVAQGQLVPYGGLIRLNGTPGDTIDRILVTVGDVVTKGQPLIEMRSIAFRQSQVEALKQQLAEAERQQAAAVERAEIELQAARMQVSQAREQAASTKRRESSLDLLKRQWEDAQEALERAEQLANDPLTKSMVSRLDIDRQRAAVTASQLQYEQQKESLTLGNESGQWAIKLAEEKLQGASKSLELAKQADPAAVVAAQLKAAEQQLESARIVSPIDGTVVSVDARSGESVAQFPLVQVADLSRIACQAEIYQTEARWVQLGQTAKIDNVAFEKPLSGKVSRIDRLVGYPQLRSADPLAKIDYRTLPVQIELSSEDVPIAARWLQLQVEATITLNAGDSIPEATSDVPSSEAAASVVPQP